MKSMLDIIMALRSEYRKEREISQDEDGKFPGELLQDAYAPENTDRITINEESDSEDLELDESDTGEAKSEEEEVNDYLQRYTDEEHESNEDEEEEVML